MRKHILAVYGFRFLNHLFWKQFSKQKRFRTRNWLLHGVKLVYKAVFEIKKWEGNQTCPNYWDFGLDSLFLMRIRFLFMQGGEAFFRGVLESMQSVYLNRNRTAKAILDLVHSAENNSLCYDHLAFRTFGVLLLALVPYTLHFSVWLSYTWLAHSCVSYYHCT